MDRLLRAVQPSRPMRHNEWVESLLLNAENAVKEALQQAELTPEQMKQAAVYGSPFYSAIRDAALSQLKSM